MDSDLNIFLNELCEAIDIDPNQFNRAKTDPMYGNFRKEVNALLEKLIKEKRTIAEKEYRDLESSSKKMAKWFDNNYSNSNDISKYKTDVIVDLKNARNQIISNDYALYVKAINNMVNIRKMILELQKTIKNDLDSAEKELNLKNIDDIKPLIRDAYNNKNNLIWKKRMDFYAKIIVCWGILLILIFSIVALGIDDKRLGNDDESIVIPLFIISVVLGISATAALFESNKFVSSFFLLIIPSFIFMLIATIVLAIVFWVLEILFGRTIVNILGSIVFVVPALCLIFGPFITKNEDIISNISKRDTEIINLKNNENEKNKRIIYLQEKIQTAKESL